MGALIFRHIYVFNHKLEQDREIAIITTLDFDSNCGVRESVIVCHEQIPIKVSLFIFPKNGICEANLREKSSNVWRGHLLVSTSIGLVAVPLHFVVNAVIVTDSFSEIISAKEIVRLLKIMRVCAKKVIIALADSIFGAKVGLTEKRGCVAAQRVANETHVHYFFSHNGRVDVCPVQPNWRGPFILVVSEIDDQGGQKRTAVIIELVKDVTLFNLSNLFHFGIHLIGLRRFVYALALVNAVVANW